VWKFFLKLKEKLSFPYAVIPYRAEFKGMASIHNLIKPRKKQWQK
jgi:hypothetical protein